MEFLHAGELLGVEMRRKMSYGALTSSFIITPPPHSPAVCLSVRACSTVCLLRGVGLNVALRRQKLSDAP